MPQTLDQFVDQLDLDRDLGDQLVHRAYLPGQPSSFADLEPPLPEQLQAVLGRRGIERLWSHQVAGVDAARRGEDVLVTTPTASGKSLIFQLPVLEACARGEPGRALFLFPLKALGQDQRTKFEQMALDAGLAPDSAACRIYDGDTPHSDREQIRRSPPRVLISNPDMLHYGILSHPGPWHEFLGSLRWIVLDELHTYRGIFGSHFHHVLQRLLRLCRRAGGDPRIIASSATASNAGDFARTLTGREFTVVEQSGAPREGRHFLLLQPSNSPYSTALQLLMTLVHSGLKTIVFTKARRMTELLHSWLRSKDPAMARRVANYRAGFLAQERRDIERQLFDGRLDAVISTSALEMGIDVGGLDACILVGYPGSMMATWQRSGRVGREGRESVTALVALPDALDQYLLRAPDQFLERECEPLIVSPDNGAIAGRHLVCAAAEMALDTRSDHDYLERHAPLIGDLIGARALARSADGQQLHALAKTPHRDVSLRGGGGTYNIISDATGRAIGTVDGVRALRECHPGAIYLHAGRQFAISELDVHKKRAIATPVDVDYFTVPLTEKYTEILELLDERSIGPLHAWVGSVRVTESVVGFERKKIQSQEKLGREELDLEPVEFNTVAMWFAAPRAVEETLREQELDYMGALHAAEHAAISLFPVLALCDRGDLGGISIPFHPQVGSGAVFLYDGYEGGVGIAESGFERLAELLDRVEDLLVGCPCEDGCPACVQSPKCGNGNRPLDKLGAQRLVGLLRGRVPSQAGEIERPALDLSQTVEPPPPRVDRAPRTPEHRFHPSEEAAATAATPAADRWSSGGRSPDLFDLGPSPQAPTRWEPGHPPAAPDPIDDTAGRPTRSAPRSEAHPVQRVAIPRTIHNTVLFDIETKRSAEEVGGWHNVHKLGVALAVACFLEEGTFRTYLEADVPQLVADLEAADLVISFNGVRFDYKVLSGYTGVDYERTLPTLDLFETVRDALGFRLGLSALCNATLGVEKSADGLESLQWYKEGRFDEIEQYCRRDVELLRDLYLFGRREGHVCYRQKPPAQPDDPNQDVLDLGAATRKADPEGRILQVGVDWP